MFMVSTHSDPLTIYGIWEQEFQSKTKRFNYKLGINSFYYPRYFSGIKTDLELVVSQLINFRFYGKEDTGNTH